MKNFLILFAMSMMLAGGITSCKSMLYTAPDYFITEYKGTPLIIKDADHLVNPAKKLNIKELNFEQVKNNVMRPLKNFTFADSTQVESDKVVITLELSKLSPYELPKH